MVRKLLCSGPDPFHEPTGRFSVQNSIAETKHVASISRSLVLAAAINKLIATNTGKLQAVVAE